MTIIDNDYHPIDQGLDATDDHWGTTGIIIAPSIPKSIQKANEDWAAADNASKIKQTPRRCGRPAIGNGNEE